MAQVKIGDVWDALPPVKPNGAGLGTAYFHAPFDFNIPNRKFADDRVADPTLLANLNAHGIHPIASGKYGSNKIEEVAASSFDTMGDWSNPGTSIITGEDVVAFYLGGWTPHVWTTTQINAQTAYWMMPIWVYNPNQPGSAQGTVDGKAALKALTNLGVPTGVRIAVDMEGSTDIPYLQAFRQIIAESGSGYHLAIYGEASTIFTNWTTTSGPGGGWWVADWTFVPHLYNHAGVWATQWTDAQNPPSWDQSVTADLGSLWWHKPVTFTATATALDSVTQAKASKSSTFVVA